MNGIELAERIAHTNELLKKANLEIAKLKEALADHGIQHCCFCGEYEKCLDPDPDDGSERREFDRGWGKHFHGECYSKNGGVPPT